MSDFLASVYPWTKVLHVISVISWMAGLFYLPRLFVYHTESVPQGTDADRLFQLMEWRLLRLIMGPASIATWIFGLALVFTPGIVDWGVVWPWIKAAAVLGMTVFHHWLMRCRKDLARGDRSRTGRQFRMANEIPTLLMVVIVSAVILKY